MTNKPKTYLLGTVKVAEWSKIIGGVERKNYTFDKRYQDKETEEWKSTNSFNKSDLVKLKTLFDEILKQDIKIIE